MDIADYAVDLSRRLHDDVVESDRFYYKICEASDIGIWCAIHFKSGSVFSYTFFNVNSPTLYEDIKNFINTNAKQIDEFEESIGVKGKRGIKLLKNDTVGTIKNSI